MLPWLCHECALACECVCVNWRVCMQVDEDAFTRKRGRYVLAHAVKVAAHSAQQPWQALLQLLALLEDFALHLIKVSRQLHVIQSTKKVMNHQE